MKKWLLATLAILTLAVAVDEVGGQSEEVSVATMPPSVVKTVPQCGDTNVDPAITEIRATFSKEMKDGNWSWTQISEETALGIEDRPVYSEDGRTCIAKVKLEPGKTYVTWLNRGRFMSFMDKDGQSAVPYLLIFQTRSDPQKESGE